MSWLVYAIDADHTGIEFGAFRTPDMRVISEHVSLEQAREALVTYRAAREREALAAAGQGDLFAGVE